MPMEHLTQLSPAYLTFFVGAMSPGPSNLTVMEVAMSGGRRDGLVVATGVVTGTMIWAILASTGLAALLITHSGAMTMVTMAGGAYLLYLAFAFGRSAFRDRSSSVAGAGSSAPHSFKALYVRGLLIHVANPKAILSWVATMSLGLQPGAPAYLPFVILAGCVPIAVLIYVCYATVFSMPPLARIYQRMQRRINCVLMLFFTVVGGSMLLGGHN